MNACALGTRGMTWEANELKFGPSAGVQPGDGKRQCLRETWQACTCCSQGREAGGTAAAKWGKKVSDGAVQPCGTRAKRRRWQCAANEEQLWKRGIGVGQPLVKKGLKLWSLSVPKSQATRWGARFRARVCVWHRRNGWQGAQVAARGCNEHMRRQTTGACCVVTAAEQPWQTRQQGS